MRLNEKSKENYAMLQANSYPGRGIIIGMSPNAKHYVQIYWIMGRSENSRNRVFENENGFVRTKAYDESKVIDPSLIIYYPVRHFKACHIVSNGDQTDTIYNAIQKGETFESALNTRTFEPDSPNFTPRISGIVNLGEAQNAYTLSILKSFNNNSEYTIRNYYNYEKAVPGTGHCIHTYMGDGNPLPSFTGEPYELELFDNIDETVEYYWNALNQENRISILGKYINVEDGSFEIKIINKYR